MAALADILAYLSALLRPEQYVDSAHNALQVESSRTAIHKVATAVDSGLSVLERAVKANCQLLIVHHGLFWGGVTPVTGTFGRKIELLLNNGCSLYGSHLPLDAHLEVGNNALLAQYFGLTVESGFGMSNGKPIGVRARAKSTLTREFFIERAKSMIGYSNHLMLPFGPEEINTVGFVSGSGGFAMHEAAEQQLDLLISGESKQHQYHDAKELKLNAFFAGHYATETFGVRALGDRLQRDFGVEHLFIDEPTGI